MRSGGLHRLVLAIGFLLAGLLSTPAHAAPADDLRAAVAALSHEAADLYALKAFPSTSPQDADQQTALEAALHGLGLEPKGNRAQQVAKLKSDDAAGSKALTRLGSGRQLSVEVRNLLQPLTAEQLSAISAGKAMTSPSAGVYLKALEDLVARNGGTSQTQGQRPEPPTVNSGIATLLGIQPTGQQPGGPQPTSPQPGAQPGASSSDRPLWPWFVVGAVVLGVAGFLLTRRRAPSSAPVALARPAAAAPPVTSILDASRRLTTLTGDEDMPRAIVREALALVPGLAAGLVERQQDELVVAHESQPGLLRPEGFHHGVIETAANTGQMLVQVITTDPSFSRQPAQVLLLPLVNAGRVDAVVVVTRDANQTFTPVERDALAAFAPVAAAARESAARTQAAVDASQIDPLTGAGNRRQLDTHLPLVLREGAGGSTGFCMIDLDHFKTVNDTFGHPAGDALLRGVCATIRSAVRPTDGVYRYGGEEFCVLLPATDLEEAADIAERVRAAITTSRYDVGSARPLTVTASLGVAVTDSAVLDDIIDRADRALYQAKQSGRNQVRRG